MKIVKAIKPYIHPGFLNFKNAPFLAWIRMGGKSAPPHYPPRLFHKFAYHHEIPSWLKTDKEARLRFLEPVSLYFDTFPDYALHEVIPMVWDCWPCYFKKMCRWIDKHHVKTAIFTSSQTADRMKQKLPELKVMWCPEAVNTSNYIKGKELKENRQLEVDLPCCQVVWHTVWMVVVVGDPQIRHHILFVEEVEYLYPQLYIVHIAEHLPVFEALETRQLDGIAPIHTQVVR